MKKDVLGLESKTTSGYDRALNNWRMVFTSSPAPDRPTAGSGRRPLPVASTVLTTTTSCGILMIRHGSSRSRKSPGRNCFSSPANSGAAASVPPLSAADNALLGEVTSISLPDGLPGLLHSISWIARVDADEGSAAAPPHPPPPPSTLLAMATLNLTDLTGRIGSALGNNAQSLQG